MGDIVRDQLICVVQSVSNRAYGEHVDVADFAYSVILLGDVVAIACTEKVCIEVLDRPRRKLS